jgi:hypothetical protein
MLVFSVACGVRIGSGRKGYLRYQVFFSHYINLEHLPLK